MRKVSLKRALKFSFIYHLSHNNPLTTNQQNALITDGTANADAKSALLRPDSQPREDTDQAVNVRPYSTDEQKQDFDDEDDFETGHSDFSAHDNDNDNDYSDDDYDDDDAPEEEKGDKSV